MNSNESEKSTRIETIVSKVKEEVKKKIEEVKKSNKSEEEEKKFAKELKDDISRASSFAKNEVIPDEIEARSSRGQLVKKEEREYVFSSFIKLIEAIKQGFPTTHITTNKNGREILTSLSKEPSFSPSSTAFILGYLGDFIFGDKDVFDQNSSSLNKEFVTRFNELKNFNFSAAKQIKEAIVDAVQNNRISGLTKEEIEKNLKLTDEEKGGRVSQEEKRTFFELFKSINTKIEEGLKNKKITYDDVLLLNDFLYSGNINKDIIERASKIDLTEDELTQYSKLFNLLKKEKLEFGFLESYSPSWMEYIHEAQKEFSVDQLKKYLERDEQGRIQISKKNRKIIKDKVRRYYYLALREIHQQHSEQFRKIISEHQDINYYLIMLRQVFINAFNKLEDMIPDKNENQEIINFIRDLGGNYLSRIYTQAEIFHDLPFLVRDLESVDKILEFLKYIYPTQIAELFDDENMYLTIARDEMVMAIRQYLVERNNQYDGSILSGNYSKTGVYWEKWFKEKYLMRLKNRLKNIVLSDEEKKDLEENSWKIEMLATYAESIGIMTLIDGEVLATSDPVPHFRNIHPLMSFLSAKHNWYTGRGRDAPGLINKYLLGMKIDMYPEERHLLARLLSKRKLDPQEIIKEIDNLIDIKTGNIFKDNLFNISSSYYQLLSLFNLPNSYNSWGGWRIQEIPKDFNKLLVELFGEKMDFSSKGKDFTSEDWERVFDLGSKLYGTSFLWWSIKGDIGRLTKEVDYRLKKLGFSDEKIKELRTKNSVDKLIKANINGEERFFSFLEFEDIKLKQRRGELFFRYLRKNPGDFLMILSQLCPEVFSYDDKKDWQNTYLFKFSRNQDEKQIASQLKSEGKNKKEIENFLKKRKIFIERWKGSYEDLVRVNSWFKKISQDKRFADDKGNFNKNKFINDFIESSSNAYFRLKKKNEKLRDQILYSNLSKKEKIELINQLRDYLKEEDFVGNKEKEFWEIFSGKDGFFDSLTSLDINKADSYFKKFGGVDNEGEINIFFDMANNWFLNNGDNNPFAADTPYYDVFKNFRYAGEDALKRTFEGNISNFKNVVSKLKNLEKILIDASSEGSLAEINKLHKEIFDTLSGLVGKDYAWRANYVLAQIVANFFAQHSILRDPKTAWTGPFGFLYNFTLRDNISLSKILTKNPYAYSMDTNGLRTYFLSLKNDNLINPEEKGPWGMEQLNKVFEAGAPEFVFGDIAPRFLWSVSIIIFLLYLKKAIEEAFEGKK